MTIGVLYGIVSQVVMSLFTFVMQKSCQTITRLIPLSMVILTQTPPKSYQIITWLILLTAMLTQPPAKPNIGVKAPKW